MHVLHELVVYSWHRRFEVLYAVWIDVDIDDAYDHVNSTEYTLILWVVYTVPMS